MFHKVVLSTWNSLARYFSVIRCNLTALFQLHNQHIDVNLCTASTLCLSGIQGIIEAYRMVLPKVKLSGPTNFSPIINHLASIASSAVQTNSASVRTHTNTKTKLTRRTQSWHMSVFLCSNTLSSSYSLTVRSLTSTRPGTPLFERHCCLCQSLLWVWGQQTSRPWSFWMGTTACWSRHQGRLLPETLFSLSRSDSLKM